MLHFLELPWRHYYEFLAGKSTGPSSLSGDIGEAISDPNLNSKPIVDFTPLQGNIPELNRDERRNLEMTSDQKIFYELACAIQA